MKAAIRREGRHFSVEEVETPSAGPGEVLVKVSHCAICGSDYWRETWEELHMTQPQSISTIRKETCK